MNDHVLALIFAIIGGVSNGIYPSFIKTKAVLAENVHPVTFQCYKSSMVFLTGLLFFIPRYLQYTKMQKDGEETGPFYAFSYWGVLSAAAWVPSGITTIFAVPRIGMSMTMAVSSATSSVLSFMVFWLVFDSKMKDYPCGEGCTYFRAPIYLAACLIGMFGMIFSKNVAGCFGFAKESAKDRAEEKPLLINSNDDEKKGPPANTFGRFVVGMISAILSGTFGATQYGIVTAAKMYEKKKHGCYTNETLCPPVVIEEFHTIGSWMISFGIGAVGMVLFLISIVSLFPAPGKRSYEPAGLPSKTFNWKVLKFAGIAAGSFWALGNFMNTNAVQLGGNAVVMPITLSSSIITSGLVGIFFYGEGGSTASKLIWMFSALFTLAAMIFLDLEKS